MAALANGSPEAADRFMEEEEGHSASIVWKNDSRKPLHEQIFANIKESYRVYTASEPNDLLDEGGNALPAQKKAKRYETWAAEISTIGGLLNSDNAAELVIK